MRATELQIGNWVKYTNPPYIKVESITKKKIGYHIKQGEPRMHYVRLSEVEPIPLTAEILERNGWATDGMYADIYLDGTSYFNYYFHEGILRRYYKHRELDARELTFLSAPGLVYVHELQHALRLCGIDKEIIL